jgi:hypothetical protein
VAKTASEKADVSTPFQDKITALTGQNNASVDAEVNEAVSDTTEIISDMSYQELKIMELAQIGDEQMFQHKYEKIFCDSNGDLGEYDKVTAENVKEFNMFLKEFELREWDHLVATQHGGTETIKASELRTLIGDNILADDKVEPYELAMWQKMALQEDQLTEEILRNTHRDFTFANQDGSISDTEWNELLQSNLADTSSADGWMIWGIIAIIIFSIMIIGAVVATCRG